MTRKSVEDYREAVQATKKEESRLTFMGCLTVLIILVILAAAITMTIA